MLILVLRAYAKLIGLELYLASRNFRVIHGKVRNYPIRRKKYHADAVERICHAVDIACIWYWKTALCLQRSAALTCLLKEYGVPAEMVIGAQQMPFRAHAWVEVEGRVVNDKSYTKEMYAVLERC